MRFCRHCQTVKPEDAFYPSLPSRCKQCKQAAQRTHRAQNSEAVAAYWREYRVKNPDRVSTIQRRHYLENRARWAIKSRVRKQRLTSVESLPYERAEIFHRDGFHCHICGESIDMTLSHPALMSPSLDHKMPLCEGGADTPGNVQAAHLICNLRKGIECG